MKVTINSVQQDFPEDTLPLTELIKHLHLSGQPVVVELNGEALLVKEVNDTQIKDADRIEIVRIVAGG